MTIADKLYYILVPFEDGFLYVMKNQEERASFQTWEDALAAARAWKAYKIVEEDKDESIYWSVH